MSRINKRIRKNIKLFKAITSDEKYLYYIKHYDKKDPFKTQIRQITIYDKLDNHGMNLLMKKVHMLKSKKEYSVDAYYKKPGKTELNYIYGNLEGYTRFSIAIIKLNQDNWFNSIDIAGTYITNSEVLIEYTFHFKKAITSHKVMHEFVSEHEIHFIKYDFPFILAQMEDLSYAEYLDQEEHCFFDCFQNIICEIFFTELGKKYSLPMEVCCQVKASSWKRTGNLKNYYLSTIYKQNNEYMMIDSFNDRFYAFHYFYGRQYTSRHLFDYFAKFSTEMYYKAFRSIEIVELEKVMRKYLNSRKKSVSANDIKWLINKLRGIEEEEERLRKELEDHSKKSEWMRLKDGKWLNDDIITGSNTTTYFREIYQKNLEYLQALSSTRDNKIIYFITIISLAVALIGLLISLWPIIKPENNSVVNKNYHLYNDNRETIEFRFSIID